MKRIVLGVLITIITVIAVVAFYKNPVSHKIDIDNIKVTPTASREIEVNGIETEHIIMETIITETIIH